MKISAQSLFRRCNALLWWLGLMVTGWSALVQAAPEITEFMADNKSTLTDEDGDFPDWIEIHNPDTTVVNLEGFFLTDDPANPQKWAFPSTTVTPGGYFVVFASGKNRIVPGSPLHTNFSLEKAGESLLLVSPDGHTPLSSFSPYPPQEKDISFGLGRDLLRQTILNSGAACRYKVPTGELPGWQTPSFSDADWPAAQTGIGYDTKTSGIFFAPYIGAGGNLLGPMFQLNATCYLRVPFVENDPGSIVRLTLRIKYDDGFAAYLNGTKVAERNSAKNLNAFSDAPTYTWDDAAVRDELVDVTEFRSLLTPGNNLLAIHGQNDSSSNRDFLLVPALDVERSDSGVAARPGFFVTATPGMVNDRPGDGFVAAPLCSVQSGFFDDPVSVTLTSTTPEAAIRYTTDGSTPTDSHGTVVSGPVILTTTTILRAVAIRPHWHSSSVTARSFLFPAAIRQQATLPSGLPEKWGQMIEGSSIVDVLADYQMDPNVANAPAYSGLLDQALRQTLPVVSLSTDADPLFGSGGLYAGGRGGEVELPVSFEYFDPAGSRFAINCGLQMHGGRAREHIKKPFRLYFRSKYGEGSLKFPLFPNSTVGSFEQLVLRPGGHDSWTATGFGNRVTDVNFHGSYLRDQFQRRTALEMGMLAPEGRYVHLYLNGLYWGVYDLHERPNAAFFAAHLGGDETDWDVLHHPEFIGTEPYSLASGTSSAWDAVLAAATAGISSPETYQNIQQFLDLDHYADSLILRMWASDYDWMQPIYLRRNGIDYFAGGYPNKNWYAGRRRSGTDTFHFFPWDGEFSMGLSYLISQSAGSLPAEIGYPPAQHLLDLDHTRINDYGGQAWPYTTLRKYPEFRRRFADRVQKHLFNGGVLAPAQAAARLAALESVLDLPIVAESARWGDALEGKPEPTTFTRDSHWRPEVAWLKETFATQRGAFVLEHFRRAGLFPFLDAPNFSHPGGEVASGFPLTLTNPNASGDIFYTTDGSDPSAAAGYARVSLINAASPSLFWVPTSGSVGTAWRTPAGPANLAEWSSGTGAVGFDGSAENVFGPHFSTAVSGMQNINPSVYLRISFSLTAEQVANVTDLELRLKYDDGFAAYLNGASAGRNLAPGLATWNSVATGSRDDSLATQAQIFPLSSLVDKLVVGANVLAIQGLNLTAADDDFLLAPELIATMIAPGPPGASAQAFSGPISLTHSGSVKARVRAASGTWSAINSASYIVGHSANASNLILSELHYHPADSTNDERNAGFADSDDFEFLELLNISSDPVELAGVHFIAGVEFSFDEAAIRVLGPGGRTIVCANAAALTARYAARLPIAGIFAHGSKLANSGERLALQAADGSMIFDFSYEDGAPWPTEADGGGASLVFRHLGADATVGNPTNWRLGRNLHGTPGGADADSFSSWAARKGVPALPLDDTDHDTVPLMREYLSDTDPATADAGLGALTCHVDGNFLTVSFRHAPAAEDGRLSIEYAAGAGGFVPANGTWLSASPNADGSETLLFRMELPNPQPEAAIVRLRMTLENQ